MQPLEADDPAVIGPYRLVARLGAGGMGRVYLARSAGGRTVAVKVVRADLADNPDFRDRFRREVAAAQSVDGAYTAPVVDADRDSATPWLATAYVLGPSLTEAVAQYGPMPEDTVRALGAVLAEALTAIHGAGLIHRDLKPSNVLLAADGPRVIDFGIARALDGAGAALTSTGVVVGSPGFMSPEQASGKRIGPEGDVFSLGSVLAFAATGHGPFGQESAASLLYRVVHESPDLERVPASLREAIGACLAKDPADRPSPEQLLRLLAPDGAAALLRGGWLPAQVASGIAQHAARVMELETPAPAPAPTPRDPRAGAAAAGAADGGTVVLGGAAPDANGTVVLGGNGTTGNAGGSGGGVPTGQAAPMPAPATPSRRKLLYGALGVVAVAAAGGGTAVALSQGDSPKPKPTSNDNTHGSASPTPQPSRPPGVAPTPVWTYQANQKVDCPPVVLGHSLLVTDESLVALDPRSGAKQWTGPALQSAFRQPPFGFGGGFLVTLPSDATETLAGYDPASGGQKWEVRAPDQYSLHTVLGVNDQAAFLVALKFPLDSKGNVNISGTAQEVVLAVDLHSRKLLWEQKRNVTPGGGQEVLGFATAKYLVYTNDNNNVVVRDTATGNQLWSQDYGLKLFPNPEMPLLAQDDLYLPGSQVVGYGLAKGDTVMTAPKQGNIAYGNLGYADGTIYCTLGLGAVLALDAHTGKQLWMSEVQLSIDASPLVVVQDTVFCTVATATGGDAIAALDRGNGHVLWTFTDAGSGEDDWWCATDGTMLYVAHDNHVYALPSR
ncbi:outer membrane protein assembly factor BamB [Streptacidiphilus sp. MAP12-33]|uniref:serine/threonine-protein kinase n=1 Tax=Streptacidiphilus sp. MAP12-33 TaxID=3156266 RepID=UPI0035196C25